MKPLVAIESRLISLLLAAGCVALGSCSATGEGPSANPTSMGFAAGGTIHMQLHTGIVKVVGGPEDRITVSWRAKSSRDQRRVSIKLQRSGAKEATLDVEGPDDDTRYRIEVPQQSNLSIRMMAGELDVSGVLGNFDAELLAGEIDVRVGSPEQYRSVRAAVTAGEIIARPWQIDLDGLWRSFKATGEGEYELRAQLLAGQITIRSDQAQDPQPGNIDPSTRSRSTK
jgi:hypothetical protein